MNKIKFYEPDEKKIFYKECIASIDGEQKKEKILTGRIFERIDGAVKQFATDVVIYDPSDFEPFLLRLVEDKREEVVKLNVCCGDDYRHGYVNIDFSDKRSDGKEIKIDLKRDVLKDGLPYDTGVIDEVVFRESLEHFNRHDGLKILQEIFRVLKIGGVLDLTVPPALQQLKILLVQMSSAKNVEMSDFFKAHERFSVWKYHDDLMGATREGSIGDSHCTLFTKEMLRPLLEFVGFKVQLIDDKIHVRAVK
jgi:SAM-dependent methyltransferase